MTRAASLTANAPQVDDTDRPCDPCVILSTEVLWAPFEDIVPRTSGAGAQRAQEAKAAAEALK